MQYYLLSALAATTLAAPVAQFNPLAALFPPFNLTLPVLGNPATPEASALALPLPDASILAPAPPAATGSPAVSPPAPSQAVPGPKSPVPQQPPPAAAPSSAPAAPIPTADPTACSRAINRLATGIQKNIQIQQTETTILDTIAKLLSTAKNNSAVSTLQFAPVKQRLISVLDQGLIRRQQNQALTPPGNNAAAGLNIIANAQLMELILSGFLTGRASTDTNMVQSLQFIVASGVKQNLQNLLDATQGCVPADDAAQQGIQTAVNLGLKTVAAYPATTTKSFLDGLRFN